MPLRTLVYVCAKCDEDIDPEAPRKQLQAPEARLLLDLHPACLREAVASVDKGQPIARGVRVKTTPRLLTTKRAKRNVTILPLDESLALAAD